MQYEKLDFKDAVEALAKLSGLEVPTAEHENPRHTVHYQLLTQAAKIYQHMLKQSTTAIAYLKQRGLTGLVAKQFGLGYAPDNWENLSTHFNSSDTLKDDLVYVGLIIKKNDQYYDRFRGRIIFPIRDVRGRVIGFGGRTLGNDLPKYLNSPETALFHKGSELYGLYEARQACQILERVIIVEGYLDVIALVQMGIPYVVASLGTALTTKHIQKLRRYTSEIIYCFDGDSAGEKAGWRALENTLPIMQDGLRVSFMFLPKGEDPDSFVRTQGANAFLELLQKALPLSDFFFQQLSLQTDLKTPDGKARLASLAKHELDKLPTSVFKDLMLQKLAQIIQISPNSVIETAKSFAAPKPPRSFKKGLVLSPFKIALILLLQHPELATTVTEIDFLKIFNTKDADNLYKLIHILQSNPQLSAGGLLEYWRDQEDHQYLAQLAAYDYPILLEGLVTEFAGTFERMRDAWHDQTIQLLLDKAKQQALSAAEKAQLQQLLQQGSRPHNKSSSDDK